MHGWISSITVEDALATADIFVTAQATRTSSEHEQNETKQLFVISTFDNEIQVAELENTGVTKEIIKEDSVPGGPVSRLHSLTVEAYTYNEGRWSI